MTNPVLKEEITPDQLARVALEQYLKNGTVISAPSDLPSYMQLRAGCFVSLKTRQGELRGCIGTIQAVAKNVAEEIIRNAIQAATADYRFSPVSLTELDNLIYSVDILSPAEPIESLEGHDVQLHGLIIETTTGRRGVLLPALPGINTAQEQLAALQHKIGISQDTPIKMSRFFVNRYGQK
jgi:AmmeMemoRadiSam system protein A